MRKLSCLAAVAALCVATVANADTVELRIVTDGNASSANVANDAVVNVFIQGRVVGGTTDGLALWGANVSPSGTLAFDLTDTSAFLLAAPVSMANFDRNLGLTNPPGPVPADLGVKTGYKGTASGVELLQVGGGQNTIGNTDPPAFPVGPVVDEVGNAGYEDFAVGTLTAPSAGSGTIIIGCNTAFANLLSDFAAGSPYPVEAATSVDCVGDLTINVAAGVADPPLLQTVGSVGTHGGGTGTFTNNVALTGFNVEGRARSAASGNISISVTFDKAIATGLATVAGGPGGEVVTSNDTPTVNITFTTLPSDDTCYTFDMAGTEAVDGGVLGDGPEDTNFCVCYNAGDVDRSGTVNAGDKNIVIAGTNFNNSPPTAVFNADLDRSGTVNAGDKNIVTAGGNFNSQTITCP